ncbi:hypothetical protein EW146_g9543, partial [Bondarzewia mesenterica]
DEIRVFYGEVARRLLLERTGMGTSLRGYCDAYALVSSRAFVVDAYHGLGMVPVADAFNHAQEHGVHLETDFDVCAVCGSLAECAHDREGGVVEDDQKDRVVGHQREEEDDVCEMVTNAPVGAGEEVFNTYGERLGNGELLVRYGFMVEGNENDVVSWTPEEVWDVAAGDEGRGGVAEAVEVLRGWGAYAGWEESDLVANVDVDGGNSRVCCVTGDGAISHGLWVMCALGVLGEGSLMQMAHGQVQMEKRAGNGNDVSAIVGVIRTVVTLCDQRLNRLGSGTGTAAVGAVVDRVPRERRKTRMGVLHALSEMSVLESCKAGLVSRLRPSHRTYHPPLVSPCPPHPSLQEDGRLGAYCSQKCYNSDNPSSQVPSSLFHQSDLAPPLPSSSSSSLSWTGNDYAGIVAWARQVSPGLPSDLHQVDSNTPSLPPKDKVLHRPKLLSICRRPLPPSLSVSSPQPVLPQPSRPILTPNSSSSSAARTLFHRYSIDDLSIATSFLTDSVLATPASADPPPPPKPSLLGTIATQMRSWVGTAKPLPTIVDLSSTKPAPPPTKTIGHAPFTHDHDEWREDEEEGGGDMLEGWFGRTVTVARARDAHAECEEVVKVKARPLDEQQHPAFRSRGRKPTRMYAYAYA